MNSMPAVLYEIDSVPTGTNVFQRDALPAVNRRRRHPDAGCNWAHCSICWEDTPVAGPDGFTDNGDKSPLTPYGEAQKAAQVRRFSTGATRDVDESKFDYEGFLSPLALKRFAEYMHANRRQKDGSLRDSDNWQKGIPLDAYMKSAWRHFVNLWLSHRGQQADEDIETSLVALMFNVQGYLHEVLKAKQVGESDDIFDIMSRVGADAFNSMPAASRLGNE